LQAVPNPLLQSLLLEQKILQLSDKLASIVLAVSLPAVHKLVSVLCIPPVHIVASHKWQVAQSSNLAPLQHPVGTRVSIPENFEGVSLGDFVPEIHL